MLFNERHSVCLCSVSNLLDPFLGGGSEPAPSHLCCEDKNTLTAGPKLCKDIVCTCNLTAGKRKLWFHWSWLEWWFHPPHTNLSIFQSSGEIRCWNSGWGWCCSLLKDVSSRTCSGFYPEVMIKPREGVFNSNKELEAGEKVLFKSKQVSLRKQ